MQETAAQIRGWLAEGRDAAVGRVVAIEGFSTWPGDELLAVDAAGDVAGAILADAGTDQLRLAAVDFLGSDAASLVVTVEIHGKAVIEAGLSCGGQASVRLDRAAALPPQLWEALCGRTPVALVSGPDGTHLAVTAGTAGAPDATETAGSPDATETAGSPDATEAAGTPEAADTAVGASASAAARGAQGAPVDAAGLGAALLASGHSATQSVDTPAGAVLVEAWVPPPRIVVVGTGDLVPALAAQASLLGWDTRAVERPDAVDAALDWAGDTAALVVLSHDPHVDVPSLDVGLRRRVAYVGAMGSRGTQGRRLDRLAAIGVPAELLERIHRPVGLDLGGRSAPEVAMAICAEVLSVRTGRDGGSLRDRAGPIHDRPRVNS